MKLSRALFACAVLLTVTLVPPVSAQYMYLDSNGDGISSGDQLNPIGTPTSVAIWLDTSQNRDGSPAGCAATSGVLDLGSYVFCLRAGSGTVSFGTYAQDPGVAFYVPFGEVNGGSEYKNGFGGTSYLPAGRYRLGTLAITAESGTPAIAIVDQVANSCDATSFGTRCAGHDFDNTYRFGICGTGDWSDVDGLGPAPPVACLGYVAGSVVADCTIGGGPAPGVIVDAYSVDTGALVATTATDANGSYTLGPLNVGTYDIVPVPPLGYSATPEDRIVEVVGGATVTADFAMQCMTITPQARGGGFWKHEVSVATGGSGSAHLTASELCALLDLIAAHFNSNLIHPVVVYEPPPSGSCADKLLVAKDLLNLPGSSGLRERARLQLMTLLLSVAAGYISQTEVISGDGATVSQAITYCDDLIVDASGDWAAAKTIAEDINTGIVVPAGMIPLSTPQILYRRGAGLLSFRVTPNPGPGARTFQFTLGQAGPVRLRIFDVSGRLVSELMRGQAVAGPHSVSWGGLSATGGRAGSGLYFARLEAAGGSRTLKVLVLKP